MFTFEACAHQINWKKSNEDPSSFASYQCPHSARALSSDCSRWICFFLRNDRRQISLAVDGKPAVGQSEFRFRIAAIERCPGVSDNREWKRFRNAFLFASPKSSSSLLSEHLVPSQFAPITELSQEFLLISISPFEPQKRRVANPKLNYSFCVSWNVLSRLEFNFEAKTPVATFHRKLNAKPSRRWIAVGETFVSPILSGHSAREPRSHAPRWAEIYEWNAPPSALACYAWE